MNALLAANGFDPTYGFAGSSAKKSGIAFKDGVVEYEGALPFKETSAGWHGYIPWADHPEWKAVAKAILDAARTDKVDSPFQPGQESYDAQLAAITATGGILGTRFSEYYMRLGPALYDWPKESWEIVLKEKSKNMLHVLSFPYNGEATKDDILKDVITPTPLHFVRNHGNIPIIDADKWTLELTGLVKEPKVITFAQLKSSFPYEKAPVKLGMPLIAPWTEQALGTARWTGVTLKTLIEYCGGLKDDATDIEFFGADTYFKRNVPDNYIVSVPIRKMEDTVIAFEMNGEPLSAIHGYPVRAVVPGYIGARSVKWLYRIKALPHPSLAPVQSEEYLYFTHQIGKHNFKWSKGFSIQGMPISSAIMSPKNGEVVYHTGTIKVKGWAYTGGSENWVERVEVSPNGGADWWVVPPAQISRKYWHAWRIWEVDVPTPAQGYLDFTVRAWDANMNTQPTLVRDGWNWDTHVTNSCHHIQIYSVNVSYGETAERLAQLHKHGVTFEPISKPLTFAVQDEEEYFVAIRSGAVQRDPAE